MNKKKILIVLPGLLVSLILINSLADYRDQEIINHPLLHVNFDHVDHKQTTCVTCHHNFLDDTGSGICNVGHKQDLSVALEIEDMFHTLCRDCHIETREQGNVAGPVRQCKLCHEKPVFVAQE
jgi:thymidine kinase